MAEISLPFCPACNGSMSEHHVADQEQNEWWSFECGAQVVLIDGQLSDNGHCRDALEVALGRINQARSQ